MNKLEELARACNDGACNVRGLVRSLGEAIGELKGQPSDSLELKIIIGQISFLVGESCGPSMETQERYCRKLEEAKHGPETHEARIERIATEITRLAELKAGTRKTASEHLLKVNPGRAA